MLGSLLAGIGGAGNGLLSLLGMGQANAQTPLQQPQSPGFGDRLMAGAQGALNSSSPMGAIGNLLGGLSTGARTDPAGVQARAIQGMLGQLVAKGQIDPTTAQFLAANPKAWEELSKAMINQPLTTIGRTGFRQGPFGNFTPVVEVPESSPVEVLDAQGNKVPAFRNAPNLGNPRGSIVFPTQPGAATAPPPSPRGGQPNQRPSIDPAYDGITPREAARANAPASAAPPALRTEMSPQERRSQEEFGQRRGQAQFDYPAAVSTITSTLDNVRGLRSAMDKPTGTGATVGDMNLGTGRVVGQVASFLGAEGSSEFQARLKQLASRVWMSEIKNMVGMGALSNAEGSRVEQAAARLQTTQDPKVFKESLDELDRTLTNGIARARLQAFGQQRLNSGSAPGGPANIPPPPRGYNLVGQ